MLVDLALSIGLAGVFGISGGGKLAGLKGVVAQFQRWRYGPAVRIAGGLMELAGAALLVVPGFTLYGVLVLLGVLGTAVYTHVVRERVPKNSGPAVVLLVLVVVLGLLRGSATAGLGGTVFRAMFG